MRQIAIVAIGSRGDVQPCVALAERLQHRGYRVRLATHPRFAPLAVARGVVTAPLIEGNVSRGFATPEGREWATRGGRWAPSWVGFLRDAVPIMRRRTADCWTACRDADVIIANPLAWLVASGVAEKARVPLVRASFSPDFALNAPGAWGTAMSAGARMCVWQISRPWVNRARRDVLGLSGLPFGDPFGELNRLQAPILDAFSEVVVPREACWGAWVHVTGYWFLDTPADWSPPRRLLQFLEAGPPPVFVGFGSMVAGEPHKVTRMVVHALHQAGQRGVIAADMLGPNPATVPDDVLAVEPLPHEWLFPRMAALVHHGGAGTTAAGLRAGCPSVLVPHFADQPFWARRVHQLGGGPRGIPRRQLSADSLARAIRAATSDEQFRHRARALGQQIAGEDGVAHAVDALSRSMEA